MKATIEVTPRIALNYIIVAFIVLTLLLIRDTITKSVNIDCDVAYQIQLLREAKEPDINKP